MNVLPVHNTEPWGFFFLVAEAIDSFVASPAHTHMGPPVQQSKAAPFSLSLSYRATYA